VRKVINIMELPIRACVYIDWYKFRRCDVRTCKNFTSATSSRCLAIDRVQPIGNKIISDAELHMFKYPKAGVSTRLISLRRKKAVQRVKAILVLHEFVSYINQTKRPDDRYWSGKLVERLELDYPLRIMKLGYMNWMLPHLTSVDLYEQFATKMKGECLSFKIHHLLDITEMKFQALLKSIEVATNEAQPPSTNLTKELIWTTK
jgi:hypothetical protein